MSIQSLSTFYKEVTSLCTLVTLHPLPTDATSSTSPNLALFLIQF